MWATYLIFLNISFFMLLTATVVQLLTDKLVEGVKSTNNSIYLAPEL